MYWRYMDCSCLGRETTDENDQVKAERAKNETTTINTIYHVTLQEINQDPELADAAAILPTLPSLKSSLYRKRREKASITTSNTK